MRPTSSARRSTPKADIGQLKAERAEEWLARFDAALNVQAAAIRVTPETAPCPDRGRDPGARRLRQFRDPAGGVGRLCRGGRSAGERRGRPVPGAGRGASPGTLTGQSCYRCFVGDAFDSDDCDSCAEDGMLGAMAGWAGTFAALQAIRVLLDGVSPLGDPQWGKLHLLDGLVPSLRTLTIAKDPECRGCGSV